MRRKTYTIDDIPKKYHHFIDEVSDERGYDSGIWVYLKRGWHNPLMDGAHPGELPEDEYCHIIHAERWREVLSELPYVEQTNAIDS